MVCFCYRRRFVAPPRLSADGKFIRRLATGCYQEMPNPTAETQTPVEIGKTNILDQRRRIERQRGLIARLESDGSPDGAEAVRILGEMEQALARMEAHHAAAQEQPLEDSVDEPNLAKAEPLRYLSVAKFAL